MNINTIYTTAAERILMHYISITRSELLGRGHIRRVRQDRRRATTLRRMKLMREIKQAVRS